MEKLVKTLMLVNISVLSLLFSWAAFAGNSATISSSKTLAQTLSQIEKKDSKINIINERRHHQRQTQRIIARPVINPLHFR